ncbi:hypothetical protein EDEG_02990, partial [Edhazardia aedis USNM 41457]
DQENDNKNNVNSDQKNGKKNHVNSDQKNDNKNYIYSDQKNDNKNNVNLNKQTNMYVDSKNINILDQKNESKNNVNLNKQTDMYFGSNNINILDQKNESKNNVNLNKQTDMYFGSNNINIFDQKNESKNNVNLNKQTDMYFDSNNINILDQKNESKNNVNLNKQTDMYFGSNNINIFDNNSDKIYSTCKNKSENTAQKMHPQTKTQNLILYNPEFECTVLETKHTEGYGPTIDCILSKGILKEGDKICLNAFDTTILTTVKNILVNEPCKEMRIKGALKAVPHAIGTCGIKIVANSLDKAQPGGTIIKIDESVGKHSDNLMQINLISSLHKNINLSDVLSVSNCSENYLKNLHFQSTLSNEIFFTDLLDSLRIFGKSNVLDIKDITEMDTITREKIMTKFDDKKLDFDIILKTTSKTSHHNVKNDVLHDELIKMFSRFNISNQNEIVINDSIKNCNISINSDVRNINLKDNDNIKNKLNINKIDKKSNKDIYFNKKHIFNTILPQTKLKVKNIAESDEEAIKTLKKEQLKLVKLANLQENGAQVHASTLGSLEALLSMLKIPIQSVSIGAIKQKDIRMASSLSQIILAFDIKIDKEILDLAQELNVKIISANIIFHLTEQYDLYMKQVLEKERAMKNVTFPCKLKILKDCVYTKRSPIVIGVEVFGILKLNTEILSIKESSDQNNGDSSEDETGKVSLGKVTGIQNNGKVVNIAKTGDKVSIKIETRDTPRVYKKHYDENCFLLSNITRTDIDILKELYKDELTDSDWRVVIELKKFLHII